MSGSVLFRHELAYVLGQMGFKESLPALEAVLRNVSDDAIVRHEAAEAMAAIGDASSLPVLEEFCSDPAPEVSETCEIGVRSLRWQAEAGPDAVKARDTANPFESVDPAPPVEVLAPSDKERAEAAAADGASADVASLRASLVDEAAPLFERYRAMFSLRNRCTTDAAAVEALCAGLKAASALFRHEVAYVLGQAARPEATEALTASLRDEAEHPMVRHEAAEALGAVGTAEAEAVLESFRSSDCVIVRESCEVALDAADYFAQFAKRGDAAAVPASTAPDA